MIQAESIPDTLAELPHVDTLRPPPLPEVTEEIQVTERDLVAGDLRVPVIAKGTARTHLAGALLTAYRALYELEKIAEALLRASGGTADERFYLAGCVELAREGISRVSAATITAARALDAEAVKP